jgi:peptidyl-prolyl cis-trans isomerase B (cyclophilin B)
LSVRSLSKRTSFPAAVNNTVGAIQAPFSDGALRAILAVTVVLSLLLLACGGGSSGAQPADFATCGPSGSRIASLQRDNQRSFSAPPERVIDPSKSYVAIMRTDRGPITIQLDAANAPNTVNNFVYLSCRGFYDGLTFHRVEKVPIPFVIQGGDPRGDGAGGPGYRFPDEISPNLNHNQVGTVAMANAGPNTNGSQFYITLRPTPELNGRYNVFGLVTAGMNVANEIRVGDKILSVSIEEK